MYLQGALKWPVDHLHVQLPALWLSVLLLASSARASTVATVTDSTSTSDSLLQQTALTTDQATPAITQLPALPTTLNASSVGITTTDPLETGQTTNQSLPTTSTATRNPPSTPVTEARSLSDGGTSSPTLEASSELNTVVLGTTASIASSTGVTQELSSTTDPSTFPATNAMPSSITLTIVEWFLLAVAVAALLLFAFLCCHCWQRRRRRKARSHSDHNKNDIEYSTPKSPKEKWRNSWALEAMVYHIELPQETDAEMEGRENPVFEEDETDAAGTSDPQPPHLTKL